MRTIAIRREKPGDEAAVHRVNAIAFGGPDEATLVDALRANGGVTLSLVAEAEGSVVGHVLFSPVRIDPKGSAIGLGPMAVLPVHQRHGIGGRLVREGLELLRLAGHGAVVVLGHPEYYPRFGFSRASGFGLWCEFDCPDEAFMAIELIPEALANRAGVVRYRPEFHQVARHEPRQ